MITIEDPLPIIASILFIYPAYVQYRNYQLTNSSEYLKFSILFLLFIIDSLIQSMEMPPFVFEAISTLVFAIVNYMIILIASGIADGKLILRDKVWKSAIIIMYLISASIELLVEIEIINPDNRSLHVGLLDMMTLIAGLLVTYAITSTHTIIPAARVNQTRFIWIVMGLLLLLIGSIRLWNNLDEILKVLFDLEIGIGTIFSQSDIIDYMTISIGVFTIILALFYPETMLISHTQIIKIAKFLNSTDDFTQVQLKVPTSIGQQDSIRNYLQEINLMLKEDIEK